MFDGSYSEIAMGKAALWLTALPCCCAEGRFCLWGEEGMAALKAGFECNGLPCLIGPMHAIDTV